MFKSIISSVMIGLTLAITSASGQAACPDQQVELQVLGSGGPELNDSRASSSYLIWVDGKARILVDTGGGSSANFESSGASVDDLQAVLFTHFHVDHSGDFAAYIKASFFGSRTEDLPIFGPAGNDRMPSTDDFLAKLLGQNGAYRYLSSYIETDQASDFHLIPHSVALDSKEARTFAINNSLSVSAIPVHHGPIAAVAWRVNIDQCSISFSGDMNNQTGNLARLAGGSQLLVAHNAIPQNSVGVARNLHMPPSEIGKIAEQAEVGTLLISHRMNRTSGQEQAAQTLAEIRKSYQGPVLFANDLDTFDVR